VPAVISPYRCSHSFQLPVTSSQKSNALALLETGNRKLETGKREPCRDAEYRYEVLKSGA